MRRMDRGWRGEGKPQPPGHHTRVWMTRTNQEVNQQTSGASTPQQKVDAKCALKSMVFVAMDRDKNGHDRREKICKKHIFPVNPSDFRFLNRLVGDKSFSIEDTVPQGASTISFSL